MDLALAQQVVAAAVAHAESIGANLSICVADAAGNDVLTARMDGAFSFTPHIARTKARTAVVMRMDTAGVSALAAHPGLLDLVAEQAGFTPTVLGGGVVVKDAQGAVLGAVAGSGGSPEQDAEAARAGAAVWLGA